MFKFGSKIWADIPIFFNFLSRLKTLRSPVIMINFTSHDINKKFLLLTFLTNHQNFYHSYHTFVEKSGAMETIHDGVGSIGCWHSDTFNMANSRSTRATTRNISPRGSGVGEWRRENTTGAGALRERKQSRLVR
jgi:hypothetical protein